MPDPADPDFDGRAEWRALVTAIAARIDPDEVIDLDEQVIDLAEPATSTAAPLPSEA